MPLAGSLARKTLYARPLAGSMPAMGGVVSYVRRIFRSIAAALPAMGGVLARAVLYARPLTGDLPAMGGVAATAGFLNRTLAGVLSFSATLSRISGVSAVRRGLSRFGFSLKL